MQQLLTNLDQQGYDAARAYVAEYNRSVDDKPLSQADLDWLQRMKRQARRCGHPKAYSDLFVRGWRFYFNEQIAATKELLGIKERA